MHQCARQISKQLPRRLNTAAKPNISRTTNPGETKGLFTSQKRCPVSIGTAFTVLPLSTACKSMGTPFFAGQSSFSLIGYFRLGYN